MRSCLRTPISEVPWTKSRLGWWWSSSLSVWFWTGPLAPSHADIRDWVPPKTGDGSRMRKVHQMVLNPTEQMVSVSLTSQDLGHHSLLKDELVVNFPWHAASTFFSWPDSRLSWAGQRWIIPYTEMSRGRRRPNQKIGDTREIYWLLGQLGL